MLALELVLETHVGVAVSTSDRNDLEIWRYGDSLVVERLVFRYLIIGGGMAAGSAAKALRAEDPTGSIGVVTSEPDLPYKRPPLSKGLWKDPEQRIDLRTGELGLDLMLGRTATDIDVEARTASLDDGATLRFEYLLLATGARARSLPDLPAGGPVLAYRTLADYRVARARVTDGSRVLVVGGGFVGSELAAGLRGVGAEVHMVFPEAAIGAARYPAELAETITDTYRDRGVQVHAGSTVASAAIGPSSVDVVLTDGAELTADLVVVGIGTKPNDELASRAGLATAAGIVVDDRLRVAWAEPRGAIGPLDHVLAAGDVAVFPWPDPLHTGRIEHEDNAVMMGAHAGRQLAAAHRAKHAGTPVELSPYTHLPFFYSDLFDDGYEAVGTLDSRLDTVVDWHDGTSAGVVYYLSDHVVVGVLLWNTWGQVDAARDLVLSNARVTREDLIGRLKG